MKLRISRTAFICLISPAVFSCGCASIVSGRHEEVTITSSPPDARVLVRNEDNQVVASGITPAKVTLKRSKGLFKKPPRYFATLDKPGFEPSQIAIKPKLNPWILGNFVALGGGLVGLAADSATGAMWRMTPDDIDRQLVPTYGTYHYDPQYGQEQIHNESQVRQASYVSDNMSR